MPHCEANCRKLAMEHTSSLGPIIMHPECHFNQCFRFEIYTNAVR